MRQWVVSESLEDFEWIHEQSVEPFSILPHSDRFPTIREVTDMLVDEAMERCKQKQTDAARLLGITQQALSARLKRRND
jgi:transcriptional regulator with AAA-type ATPase domain